MSLFREKPVAVVFDWDKTLSPVYQQAPIFASYGVDEKKFWALTHARTKKNRELMKNTCFVEHEYLNTILDYVKRGVFKGLNNEKLTELGKQIPLYKGVEGFMYRLKAAGAEIYIVSGGIRSMLMGHTFVQDCVTEVYAADFADYILDDDCNAKPKDEIQSIICSVIPTDKIRILNEISKGCKAAGFDSNVTLAQDERRIPFKNMIYVGDGVSDIHAFETVRRDGGYALAVYNPEEPQFDQAEMLRSNGWVDLMAVADYSTNSTLHDWIINKVNRLQYNIRKEDQERQEARLAAVRSHAPRFIHAWSKED